MGLILPFRANRLAFPGGSPGVNYAHPASQNLRTLIVPQGANGLCIGGTVGLFVGSTFGNGTYVAAYDANLGLGVSNTANFGIGFQEVDLPASVTGSGYTFAGFVRTNSVSTSNVIVSLGNCTQAGDLYLSIGVTGGSTLAVRIPATFSFDSGLVAQNNVPYFCAASLVYRGSSTWDSYWVLKRLDTGQVLSSSIHTTGVAGLIALNGGGAIPYYAGAGNFSNTAGAKIGPAMTATSALTLSQLLRWADDPWSFWYPQKFDLAEAIRTPTFIPAGGGSDTSRGRAIIFQSKPNRLAFPGTNALPGINPAHLASRNLLSMSAVCGTSGNFVNIPTGAVGGNGGGTPLTPQLDPIMGPSAYSPAASSAIATFPLIAGDQGKTNIAFIGRIPVNGASFPTLYYAVGSFLSSGGGPVVGFTGTGTSIWFANGGAGAQNFFNYSPIYGHAAFIAVSVSGASLNYVVRSLTSGQIFSGNFTVTDGSGNLDPATVCYIGNRSDLVRNTLTPIAAAMMSEVRLGGAFSQLSIQQLRQWADDPWAFWYPQRIDLAELLRPPPPSGPTGTLAATEAPDVAAFAGTVAITGTLATTEAADIAAFTGAGAVSGTLATTEATDVAAFAGTVAITGTLATTEATDVAAFAGTVSILGTLATTEATDIAAFAGSFSGVVTGTLAATEAPDAAAFAGTVTGLPVGIFVAQELPDSMIFAVSYQGLPTAPSPYPSPLDYGWYNSEPDVWIDRGRPGGGTQD